MLPFYNVKTHYSILPCPPPPTRPLVVCSGQSSSSVSHSLSCCAAQCSRQLERQRYGILFQRDYFMAISQNQCFKISQYLLLSCCAAQCSRQLERQRYGILFQRDYFMAFGQNQCFKISQYLLLSCLATQ